MYRTTKNPGYGFHGTIGLVTDADAAFDYAVGAIIAEAAPAHSNVDQDHDAAVAFLDSRMGRHFADEVIEAVRESSATGIEVDEMVAAIELVAERWDSKKFKVRDAEYLPGTARFVGRPRLQALLCYFMAQEAA